MILCSSFIPVTSFLRSKTTSISLENYSSCYFCLAAFYFSCASSLFINFATKVASLVKDCYFTGLKFNKLLSSVFCLVERTVVCFLSDREERRETAGLSSPSPSSTILLVEECSFYARLILSCFKMKLPCSC